MVFFARPCGRPGQSAWFCVGRASSFPDIQPPTADDGTRTAAVVSTPRPCAASSGPVSGCKVFHVVDKDGIAQATEVSIRDGGPDIEDALALKDQVLVFQYKGKFHAVDHKCPHMSYPLSCASLFEIEDFGIVLSAGITCPKHAWSFDLFTGLGDRGNYRLRVWEVQLRDPQANGRRAAEPDSTTAPGAKDQDKEVWAGTSSARDTSPSCWRTHSLTMTDSHAGTRITALRRPKSGMYRAAHAAVLPLRGITYCLARFGVYRPLFAGRLLPLAMISFLVYLLLFAFAFLPQFAFLAIFHGWGAWVNAVVLVLGEGLVITQGLFEGFFVDETRVDVFDAVLIDRGFVDLVSPQRLLFVDAPNSVQMLGRPTVSAAYQPWSLVQIVELIACLPLNLIPVVGTPAFLIITGTRLGKLALYRWCKLRRLSRKERNAEVARNRWGCVFFGTMAMLLELVPVLSFFLLLTTAAGAALWTAELETARRHAEQADDEDPEGAPAPAPTGLAEPSLDAAGVGETDAILAEGVLPSPYEDDPV